MAIGSNKKKINNNRENTRMNKEHIIDVIPSEMQSSQRFQLETLDKRKEEDFPEVCSTNIDLNLVQLFQILCLSVNTIGILTREELTLDDVLEMMSREQLRRIGLKTGPELRIWQAVQEYRNQYQKRKILEKNID